MALVCKWVETGRECAHESGNCLVCPEISVAAKCVLLTAFRNAALPPAARLVWLPRWCASREGGDFFRDGALFQVMIRPRTMTIS